MRFPGWRPALVALAVCLVPALLYVRARGSDHADTPEIAGLPGGDLTDVFIFPSPANASNVVLVMDVHGLIPTGQAGSVAFDPNILYQFKIDNNGDKVEDLVIQASFKGVNPATQQVMIAGPVKPTRTGTVTQLETADANTGTLNSAFTLTNGMKVYAGQREDPFFFDLTQFFTIFPDRATPVTGKAIDPAQANTPQATTWRAAGVATDYLANLNCLSVVVEMPKSMLGTGKIGVWCTTSR